MHLGTRTILFASLWWVMTTVSRLDAEEIKPPESTSASLPERVETFTIHTESPTNQELRFFLRTPKNYVPGKVYRLLFLGGMTGEDRLGCAAASMHNGAWLRLADEQDWFILTGVFTQNGGVRDRNLMFFYPETFSGKATLEALNKVAQKYPVDSQRILMQGLSGGAQFVHRFAIWAPDRVTAVSVNSCSWFDPPNPLTKQVAWLITVGDADPAASQTLEMIDQLKAVGASPVCRSYLGAGHGDNTFAGLSMAFLKCHDELTRKDLGKPRTPETPMSERLSMLGEKMPFVGDMQSWEYMPNTPENRALVSEETKIFLPSEDVAKMWGGRATE